jgi:hypothetical protein
MIPKEQILKTTFETTLTEMHAKLTPSTATYDSFHIKLKTVKLNNLIEIICRALSILKIFE